MEATSQTFSDSEMNQIYLKAKKPLKKKVINTVSIYYLIMF